MGDTKKIRKKYETPMHPYNSTRIEQERSYRKQFGLQTKKELWKAESLLKSFKDQIKSFPSLPEERAADMGEKLRARLVRLGIIGKETPLGSVLGLDAEAILKRRLQTIVFKKGMARTIKQARQLINHEHITVEGRTINAPSYMVTASEESRVEFHPSSSFGNEMHPERQPVEHDHKKPKKVEEVPKEEQPEVVELTEEDLVDE